MSGRKSGARDGSRLAVIAVLLVVLALSAVPAASGQSEAPLDPMRASVWTGTWTYIEGSFVEGTSSSGPDYTDRVGVTSSGTVTAADARIVGTMTQVLNVRGATRQEGGDVNFANGTVRTDNDEAAWVGTFTSYGGGAIPLAPTRFTEIESEEGPVPLRRRTATRRPTLRGT